jgi:hypothetical protein
MKVNLRNIFVTFGISQEVRRLFSAKQTAPYTAQLGSPVRKLTGMQNGDILRSRSWALAVVTMMAVLTVVMGATPTTARWVIDDGGDTSGGGDAGGGSSDNGGGGDACLSGIRSWFTATPTEVRDGEFMTLAWQVTLPPNCPAVLLSISNGIGPVDPQGSQLVQVTGPGPWHLVAQMGDKQWTQDTASVRFISEVVTITSDNEVEAFVTAISKPYAHVVIQNHVKLDLSGRDNLYIAPGVHIIGGRSATDPGPRLFTSTFPLRLFQVGSEYVGNQADNVRISGVRLEGAEIGNADSDDPGSVGITVWSSVHVEIDNNELFGWRGSALQVRDPFQRVNSYNYNTVWVHDNFIHNNMHLRREGYGVAVYESAYALIETNVFDYNRHAIASSGDPGTGYYAVGNLVLDHGGVGGVPLPFAWHTHMFDVHGTQDCYGSGSYCGPAGEYFVYTDNTILYTKGTAIKVRGKPSAGAFATRNVFAHSDQWGGIVDDGAMAQNPPGDNFYATGNTFGADFNDMLVSAVPGCDFNGDSVPDAFLATGATWWYHSNALGPYSPWRHLRMSPTKRDNLIFFGDVNSDGICDVKDDTGVVYLGGVTAVYPPSEPQIPFVIGETLAGAESAIAASGLTTGTVSYINTCDNIGLVAHQSPAAGSPWSAGQVVNLSIGKRARNCTGSEVPQ